MKRQQDRERSDHPAGIGAGAVAPVWLATQPPCDGTHANVAGDYLLGCVWFEFFFGVSPVDNSFVPDKLDAKDAAILRRIAHEVGTFKFGLDQ